jgi:hypothetical protein
MMLTILMTLGLPLGAVMLASGAGALLVPLRRCSRRTLLVSQWSGRQTPICSSFSRSGTV